MSTASIVLHDEHSLNGEDIQIPPSAHTLAGFRAWAKSSDFPERGHISYIGGEIYIDMSPEEIQTHNLVKTEVSATLYGLSRKLKLGRFFSDRTLVSNVEAEVSNEPDATFVTWQSLRTRRVRPVPREDEEGQYMELEGSPDLVVEIVSDSSVSKDTRRMRERYHRAGIREYWLIDARGDDIDFQILHNAETGYVAAASEKGWQPSRVFGRRFRLFRRRGRMNFWDYTLQVKK